MNLRQAAAVALVVCPGLLVVSCGDGTQAFCGPLKDTEDLSSLSAALNAADLERASGEAQRLRDLADDAPPEIRADFVALAAGVVDVVDLIAAERTSAATTTTAGTAAAASTAGTAATSDPGEVERRRDELNTRLGELDQRSDRISAWASEQCGLDLS